MSDGRQILPEDDDNDNEDEVVGEISHGEVARVVNLTKGILASARSPLTFDSKGEYKQFVANATDAINKYKQVIAKSIAIEKSKEKLTSGEHFLTAEHKQRIIEAKQKSPEVSVTVENVPGSYRDREEEIVGVITSQFLTGFHHIHTVDFSKSSEYQTLANCVRAYIRTPSEETMKALSSQVSEMELNIDEQKNIKEMQEERAVSFIKEVIAGDALVVIKKYKEEMQNQYGLSSEETINRIVDLFKDGLNQIYEQNFNDSQFDEFFSIVRKLIISSDGDEMIAKKMNEIFEKQWKDINLNLTLIPDDIEEIELGVPGEKVYQAGPSSRVVTRSMSIAQECVKGIQALKAGIDEKKKKEAVSAILACIGSPNADIAEISEDIIGQYGLVRNGSSSQIFSSKNTNFEIFIFALIGEVRRRINDKEEAGDINELIAQAVMDFNQGKVNYALWVSSMSQKKAEFNDNAEATASAKKIIEDQARKDREHKKSLYRINEVLEESKEKVLELKEMVQGKDKLLAKSEKEKREAKKSYEDQIEFKDQQIVDKEKQIAELKRNLRQQQKDMEQSHAAQIKEKDIELKRQAATIEQLEKTVASLKSQVDRASGPSKELLDKIVLLEKQLADAVREAQEKDNRIIGKDVLEIKNPPVKRSGKTILKDELLRIEQERLEQENASLKHRLAELEAAAAAKALAEEKKPKPVDLVSPSVSIPTVDSLSPIIIALGTFESSLRGKVESRENKESLVKVSGLIEKLIEMQADEKATPEQIIAVTKECVGIISTLHSGLVLTLPEQQSSHISVVKWIQQAAIQVQQESRKASVAAVVQAEQKRNIKDAKNDSYDIDKTSHFTNKDLNIIFAAIQAEEMGKNGWKVDAKKLEKLEKEGKLHGKMTEFTIPLMLEKPRRLLWSGQQSVGLRFVKENDGKFKITSPSKDINTGLLVGRIAKSIADPKKTREFINKNNLEAHTKIQSKK